MHSPTVLALLSVAAGGHRHPLADVLSYVDIFIGTGGAGFGAGGHNPGGTVPFGILRLGQRSTIEEV